MYNYLFILICKYCNKIYNIQYDGTNKEGIQRL